MAWVNVEIDLDEIDSDDLIDELTNRGYDVSKAGVVGDFAEHNSTLHEIVQMHRTGNPQWQAKAIEYLYEQAGKIV